MNDGLCLAAGGSEKAAEETEVRTLMPCLHLLGLEFD